MRSASAATLTRTIDLDHDQLLVVQDRPGTCVDVYFGGLWLTEERRASDCFVTPDAPVRLQAPGRAVLQAVGKTRARLVEPARRQRGGWPQLLRVPARLQAVAARAGIVLMAVTLSLGLPELVARSFLQAGALAG